MFVHPETEKNNQQDYSAPDLDIFTKKVPTFVRSRTHEAIEQTSDSKYQALI